MNFKIVLLALLVVFVGCKSKEQHKDTAAANSTSKIKTVVNTNLEVYDFAGLETMLHQNDAKIHVINFWATWCAPCVKELPYFEKINAEYANKNVEVLLVSLDFPHLYNAKLKPFIKEKNLKSKVIALDDADMNTWIPKVDATWSGALPATLIYRNGERKFFEKSFTYQELENEIKQFSE